MARGDLRYFEDLKKGEDVDCGAIEVSKEEMLEFAERYDPQPFHVDEDAAQDTMYGDLIASGMLVCSLSTRLFTTGYVNEHASLGGSGLEVEWHKPVYADDTLSVHVKLVEKMEGDDPRFGYWKMEVTTKNQHGDVVLTMLGIGLTKKRGQNET